MKRENVCKLLFVISALLIMGFAVRLGIDFVKYDNGNDSAPFYIYVAVRAVEFIVPSAAAFIAGLITRRRYTNK